MKDSNKKQEGDWIQSIDEALEELRKFALNGSSGKINSLIGRLTRARGRLQQRDPDWKEGLFDD